MATTPASTAVKQMTHQEDASNAKESMPEKITRMSQSFRENDFEPLINSDLFMAQVGYCWSRCESPKAVAGDLWKFDKKNLQVGKSLLSPHDIIKRALFARLNELLIAVLRAKMFTEPDHPKSTTKQKTECKSGICEDLPGKDGERNLLASIE